MTPVVAVVIPFYSEFEACKPGLRELRASTLAHGVKPIQGSCIANNRNSGVTTSQRVWAEPFYGYSHFLFVDSDIGFSAEDVFRLINFDLPIVGCPYLRHQGDGTYQAGEADDGGNVFRHYPDTTTGLQAVDFIGAGFLMVKREAFYMMRNPYFRYGVLEVSDESGDAIAANITEDVGFCINARHSGLQIWCDFDHPVYHRPRKAEDFDVAY